MYIVTVTFEVAPQHAEAFRPTILAQATNSLSREEGCHQFDVAFDADNPAVCFLYEKYTDRAAFDLHLQSDHFKDFDATVASWVVRKEVGTWIEATD